MNAVQRLRAALDVRAWIPREWADRNLRVGILTAIMLVCLPLALISAEWLQANAVLWKTLFLGALVGLWIAQTRWMLIPTLAAIIVVGLLVVTQHYSRALPPLAPALRELAAGVSWLSALLFRGLAVLAEPGREHPPLTPPPDFPEWRAAGERLWLYSWNLQADWPLALVPRRWESGQVLLGTALGLMVWLVAALVIWMLLRRRSAWGALILVAAPLAYSVSRTWDGWAFLVVAVIAGALLACDSSLHRLERRWGMGSSPYGLTLAWWVWAGAMALVVAGAMGLAIKLTDPAFQEWLRDTFSPEQAAQSGGSPSPYTSVEPTAGVWPRQHLLGSGPELAETPVMSVRTPGVPPTPFYWRAGSYDEYTGHGWIQNPASSAQAEGRILWPVSVTPPPHFALLRQSYRLVSPTRRIYAVGRPVRLTLAADGEWSDPWGIDLVQVRAVTAQAAYEAVSWVPTATPDELRAASTDDYPDWAVNVYLALPEELPERVGELAQEITADAPSAYDQALALQRYLRNYEYTLDLPTPPADRDVVDYFLFDLQQGYCDYYATAMVVMARSLGIPARLAFGYATGEYNPELEAYQVTQANAHSWVEIYFPEYGWIRFEPTATLPEAGAGYALDWDELTDDAQPAELFPLENVAVGTDQAAAFPLWPLLALLAGLGGLGGLIGAALAYQGWRLRRGTPEQVASRLYGRLLDWGRRLGLPLSAALTPDEFLAAFRGELDIRAARAPAWSGDWRERYSQAEQVAGKLVALYAEGCYSPRTPTQEQVERVLADWGKLSRALWGFWLVGPGRKSGRKVESIPANP